MVRKFQRKFIIIATSSALFVLLLAAIPINIYVYLNTVNNLHSLVTLISNSDGKLPSYDDKNEDFQAFRINKESRNEIRFFSIGVSSEGEIEYLNMDRITTVSSDKAFDYANEALDLEKNPNFFKKLLSSGDREGILKKKGFVYYYKISDMDDGNSLLVFVDATSRMENVNVVKDFTVIIVLICFLVFFLLVSIMSKRVVRSFVENYEKQKMFITNAGHELKTPLAIISANTEVVEMVSGESEWTKSIKNQVERMTKLIGELITLAKADEKKNVTIEEFDFSEMIQSEADSFKTVATQSGKTLETQIEESITIKSDKNGLREVISVLTDNAIKYCDEEGIIKVESHKKGKKVYLSVSNTYAEGKNVDFSKFFDRFYRADESHNSEKKGYGIGLSLAEACIKGCKGKINVTYADDTITFNVILPL